LGIELCCPRCGAALVKSAYNGRIGFVCPQGHGIALTLGAVRALCGSRELVNLLWHKSGESGSDGGAPCPVCGKPMNKVALDVEGQPLELDICRRCQEAWFDPNELETLPPPSSEAVTTEKANNASAGVKKDSSWANSPLGTERLLCFLFQNVSPEDWDHVENPFRYIAVGLGLPVEADAPPLRRLPLVTWTLIFGCIATCVLTYPNLDMLIREWGVIPAEFARKDGATWLTSMFLHDGFWPLIGNMYCLWLFGDNVEDELGKIGYLGFILLSGFTASLCYLLPNTGATHPCIGAGGFIAGIIALYAVLYPKVTIGITGSSRMLVAIPAWLVFVLWTLFQLFMTYLTYGSKNGGVAYAAHLGGAIPGLICGFIMRYIRARRAEELDI